MQRRTALVLIACAIVFSAPARSAQAQDFSGKPIRLLVGLAAGGATDVMARLVAQKMSENLRTTVFVENKVGGNFIPALRELAASPADGHTLFFISTSTLITQPLHPDYPFDLTQLTPITQVATGPLILVVKNSLGIKTLGELIDHAKANPGKLSFGAGGGTGSSLYFATELLKAKTGIKITIVNYRGAGPALNDLLGGHIDGMFDAMPVMVAQAKEGKVTPPVRRCCPMCRRSSSRACPATRCPVGLASWPPRALRRPLPSACATRSRRPWQRRMSCRRWPRKAWSRLPPNRGIGPTT
jgi:tripartite-type tricarboxylate transporter receptor subunit TctC